MKNRYHKSEILTECLKVQKEMVTYIFGEDADPTLRLWSVRKELENRNREKLYIANEELDRFRDETYHVTNMIRSEISGGRGEYMTFKRLEKLNPEDVLLKNVELRDGEERTEIDGVVITPKAIFILEVKNTQKNIFLDENGDYYRVGEYTNLDSNIKNKLDKKERLLRKALSDSGIDDLRIRKMVVFTNNRIEIRNKCKEVETVFLAQLPYEIDEITGENMYSSDNICRLQNAIEEARVQETYELEVDLEEYKRHFAELCAILEESEEDCQPAATYPEQMVEAVQAEVAPVVEEMVKTAGVLHMLKSLFHHNKPAAVM